MANEVNIMDTLYAHPNQIQATIIDDLESRFGNGGKIVDGNNVACFLIEKFGTMVAGVVQSIADVQDSLYPARAQTMQDLYRHMSDYDYLSLFAAPSTATIRLQLNKEYLWSYGIETRDADGILITKTCTIPAGSKFLIGSYTFGIYYPIDIIMTPLSENGDFTITAVQNNANGNNPLYILQYNSLVTEEVENLGLKLINIDIPIYQFEIAEYTEDMIANTGFSKRYSYTDEFYALRVYTQIDGNWMELKQTMSEAVYQTDVLTVRFAVEPDAKQVKLTLPQVFFTEQMVGSKLKIEIYTTKGALDVDLTNYNQESLSAEILHNTEASAVFNQIPELQMTLVSSKITGGSNGNTFEEFKNIVVNRVSSTALVTDQDLTNYFNRRGYVFERYLDGIEERIYKCHSVFTDSNGYPLSAGVIRTSFDFSILKEYFDTSITNDTRESKEMKHNIMVSDTGDSVMILPSTIYQYDSTKNRCIPIVLPYAPSDELLNDNQYTFSPFHVRLDMAGQYPSAGAYDFSNPVFDNLVFNGDDSPSVTQLNIIDGTIVPKTWEDEFGNKATGFQLMLVVRATSDLDNAKLTDPNADVVLYMEATSASGGTYWLTGTLKAPEGSMSNKDAQYDGNYVYTVDLITSDHRDGEELNMQITRDHKIGLRMNALTSDLTPIVDNYDLQFSARFSFLISKSWSPAGDGTTVQGAAVTNPAFTNYTVVIRQSATIKLGSLISEMHYPVSLDYATPANEYYPIDMMATYSHPVYEIITGVNGMKTLQLQHKVGDPVIPMDDQNQQIPMTVTITYKENAQTGQPTTAVAKSVVLKLMPKNATPTPEGNGVLADVWMDSIDTPTWKARLLTRSINGKTRDQYVIYRRDREILSADASFQADPNFPGIKNCYWLWDIEAWNNAEATDIWDVKITSDTPAPDTYFAHRRGEIYADLLDTKQIRDLIYTIEMPQVDAKSLYAEDGSSFLEYCQDFLRTHFLVMDNARTQLLENTKLYYEPFLSIGNGSYVNADTERVELPLDVTMSMQLYVAQDTLTNQDALAAIRKQILTIIDKHFSTNSISCSKISKDILQQLSDVVKFVDIYGLNGDSNLQTLLCVSNYVSPHLKHVIVTESGGKRVIKRALTITFTAVTV